MGVGGIKAYCLLLYGLTPLLFRGPYGHTGCIKQAPCHLGHNLSSMIDNRWRLLRRIPPGRFSVNGATRVLFRSVANLRGPQLALWEGLVHDYDSAQYAGPWPSGPDARLLSVGRRHLFETGRESDCVVVFCFALPYSNPERSLDRASRGHSAGLSPRLRGTSNWGAGTAPSENSATGAVYALIWASENYMNVIHSTENVLLAQNDGGRP